IFPNSASLIGSESGGGLPPPRSVLRLFRTRNSRELTQRGKKKGRVMNPLIQLKNDSVISRSRGLLRAFAGGAGTVKSATLKSRNFLLNAALMLASTLLTVAALFGIGEVALRWKFSALPPGSPPEMINYDERRGWSLRPGDY